MAKGTKKKILDAALIHLCDREPEKAGDAPAQAEAFSRHFIRVYGETGQAPGLYEA